MPCKAPSRTRHGVATPCRASAGIPGPALPLTVSAAPREALGKQARAPTATAVAGRAPPAEAPLPQPPANALTALPGISDAIQRVNRDIRRFASDDGPVLVTGDHGTEKAFAAKIIHVLSARAAGPLSRLNVSFGLPAEGPERFRACDRGTLIVNLQREFPDEVQYLLLEMANDGACSDPATGALVEADARIVLTTGIDVDAMAAKGRLLPELADLAKTRRIHIPPVRERPEDIPALVRYAIERAHETGRTRAKSADAQVLSLFRQLSWQGNAEDLLLVTAEAAMNADGEAIGLANLPEGFLAEVPHEILAAARAVVVPAAPPPSMVGARPDRPRRATPPKPAEQEVQPDPPTDPEEPATVTEDSVEDEIAAEAARAAQTDDEAQRRQLERLAVLSRRIRMQSQLLSKQLNGPLAEDKPSDEASAAAKAAMDEMESLSEAIEAELDKGLDSVLALRRMLAQLNRRERETLLTARDLYRRLLLAGRDDEDGSVEMAQPTGEMAAALRQLQETIDRLSGRVEGIDPQAPSAVAESLRAEEKNLIADAVLRAERRARDEAADAASGPLTKFFEKPAGLSDQP